MFVSAFHCFTGINVRQYKAVLICAYILAALVIFGIGQEVSLLIVFWSPFAIVLH